MKLVCLRRFSALVGLSSLLAVLMSLTPAKAFAADISVAAPTSGAVVNSPFVLQASSSSCKTQPTASMAYSLDTGGDTVFNGGTSINTNVSAGQGTHTLRVKSWGNSGSYCENDVAITVGTGVQVSTPVNGSTVPSSFLLQASAPTCGGQTTSSMAFSFDSNADNLRSGATSINETVSDTAGVHILRVKAWGSGTYCETDLNITISTQSVVVNTPSNNATVGNPFLLQAQAATCNSHTTSSMAFSFDSNSDNSRPGAKAINENVTAPSTGTHTLRVKAWSVNGDFCETDVSVNVTTGGSDITITTPSDPNVAISFPLQASAPTCLGIATSSMAYSFDSLTDHTFTGTSINTTAAAPGTGAHILHVKAWNTSGGLCLKDMDLNVINNGLVPGSTANAFTRIELDPNYTGTYAPCGGANGPNLRMWQTQPDCGTPGTKSGTTNTVSPSLTPPSGDSQVRQYSMSYDGSNGAGVRWFDDLASGGTSNDAYKNFQYDAWVYFADQNNVSAIYNVEMDLNQTITMGNGTKDLYIFATQCNTVAGHWQLGNGWPLTADQTCTQSQWSPGWHHVQIQFHRGPNPGDPITYDAEAIDGSVHYFTCSGGSCTSNPGTNSNWAAGVIGPNFQLDGRSGYASLTADVDQFTVYRW